METEIGAHIYTTDFFQLSVFNPEHQIISIYYSVKAPENIPVPLRTKKFDFDEQQLKIYESTGETETFHLIDWEEFSENSVSLPIDKIVARMIKNKITDPS